MPLTYHERPTRATLIQCNCGYLRGNAPINNTCPECGTPWIDTLDKNRNQFLRQFRERHARKDIPAALLPSLMVLIPSALLHTTIYVLSNGGQSKLPWIFWMHGSWAIPLFGAMMACFYVCIRGRHTEAAILTIIVATLISICFGAWYFFQAAASL